MLFLGRVWRAHIEVVKHVRVLFSLENEIFKLLFAKPVTAQSAIVPESPYKVKRLLISGGVQGSRERGCVRQQAVLWSLFHHTVVSASA